MIGQPSIRDNYKMFVGANIAATATKGAIASPAILARGEIVITDASNVILAVDTLAGADKIKIVMGRGADKPLWQSQLFGRNDIELATAKLYQNKVQTVKAIGFNGTAGAMGLANNVDYTLVVSFYELLSQEMSSLMSPITVNYTSDSTATQEEVTNGLYSVLVKQLANWTPSVILAERLNSAAGAAVTGTATDLIFTQGSKIVQSQAVNTTITNVAVGDYIRIGGVGTAVYKVAAFTQGTNTPAPGAPAIIELDVPYQGPTISVAVGTARRITNADAIAANFGIRLTGLNQRFVLDSRPAGLLDFVVGLQTVATGNPASIVNTGTTMTTLQTPFIGHGTVELIRTKEAASWRNQGQLQNYTEFPPIEINTDILNSFYSTFYIKLRKGFGDLVDNSFIAGLEIAAAHKVDGNGNPVVAGNVVARFDTNFAQLAAVADSIAVLNVLNAFLVSAGKPAFSEEVTGVFV